MQLAARDTDLRAPCTPKIREYVGIPHETYGSFPYRSKNHLRCNMARSACHLVSEVILVRKAGRYEGRYNETL